MSLVRPMKRAMFYKVSLGAAAGGAVIAAGLLASWKFAGVPFHSDLWITLYPASLMLMLTENSSIGGTLTIVAVSIATNAALYFIAASACSGLLAALRGGLHD